MAIGHIGVGDEESISKINQAIDKANLVDGKAEQAAVDAKASQAALDAESAARASAISGLQTQVDTKASQSALDSTNATVATTASQAALDAVSFSKASVAALNGTNAALVEEVEAREALAGDLALTATDVETGNWSRPGEAARLWTQQIEGNPGKTPPLSTSMVAVDSEGSVVRVSGAKTVGPIRATRVEPGRLYRVRFVMRRRVNPADPANHAVRLALRWLASGKGALKNAAAIVQDITTLLVANGRTVVTAVVARAAGAGVDHVAPAGAVYFRPYVQTYGDDGVTDVEVVEVVDVTDAVLVPVDVGQFESRVEALEGADASVRLDEIETQIGGAQLRDYLTLDAVGYATISETVDAIRVNQFDTSTLASPAVYPRAAVEPDHEAKVQSADGAWWGLGAAPSISLAALGAKANGVDFENVAQLNAMMASAAKVGIRVFEGLDRSFRINGSTPLIVPKNCMLRGARFDAQDMGVGSKLFSLPGTQATAVLVSTDALYGAYTVNVVSTAGIIAGDTIFIGSNDLWASNVQTVTRGEVAQVYAVTGLSTLTLSKPLDDNYRVADGAYVRKLNGEYDGAALREIEATGAGGGGEQYGVDAQYVTGLEIADVVLNGFDDRGINVLTGYAARVRNARIKRCRRTSLAYSIAVLSGSRDIEIMGGNFFDARHGVTFGGSTGVCRDGRVISCLSEFVAGGFDCHPGTAHILFEACQAVGDRGGSGLTTTADQFSLNGYDITAVNCSARHGVRSGFVLAPQAEFVPRGFNTGTLIGCRVENAASTSILIDSTGTPNTPLKGVDVASCRVLGASGSAALLVRTTAAGGDGGPISGLTIRGLQTPDCSIRGIQLSAKAGAVPGAQGAIHGVVITGCNLDLNAAATAASLSPVVNANATDVLVNGNRLASDRGSYVGTGDDKLIYAANSNWVDTVTNNPSTQALNRIVQASPYDKTVTVTLAIAAGVITVPLGIESFIIDTEGAAATDDLTDILGGVRGRRIYLRTAASARDVVVKTSTSTTGASKIYVGAADLTLDSSFDRLVLEHDGSRWVRVASADNA